MPRFPAMPRRRAVNEHVGLGGSVLHCKTLHCTYGDEERKHTDKRFFSCDPFLCPPLCSAKFHDEPNLSRPVRFD